jgi:DNA-binding MarR family transcriptional regulator
MSELDDQAAAVVRHYPRIYVACHVDHKARRGQGPAVSARDQTLLVHVPDHGVRPHLLAAHLDLAPSTLSEALKRLVSMKLVTLARDPKDARSKIVRLTQAGRAAQTETSVLDIARVRAALARATKSERAIIVRGLALLADSAQARP